LQYIYLAEGVSFSPLLMTSGESYDGK